MEKMYLTTKELCEVIGYCRQTIYNKKSEGVFVEGEHFIKPSHRKMLFRADRQDDILAAISTKPSPDSPQKKELKSNKINKKSKPSNDSRINI